MICAVLFGAADPTADSAGSTLARGLKDGIITWSVLGTLIVAIFIWAAFFRRKRKHRKHHRTKGIAPVGPPPEAHASSEIPAPEEKRRRRWRRSSHPRRPLNPTLAERGGLPPIRGQKPEETEM